MSSWTDSSSSGSPHSVPSDMESERFGSGYYQTDEEKSSSPVAAPAAVPPPTVAAARIGKGEPDSSLPELVESDLRPPQPQTKPPMYPKHLISTLTKTSNPKRLYPSTIAPQSDPMGLLHVVEKNWRGMARRFAIQDIQSGRTGKGLEHVWNVDGSGLIVIVQFDLNIGQMALKQMGGGYGRSWNVCDIPRPLAMFLDSFIDNAEWVCPLHMTGSRIRAFTQKSKRAYLADESYESRMPLAPLRNPPRAASSARHRRILTAPGPPTSEPPSSPKPRPTRSHFVPTTHDESLPAGPCFPLMPSLKDRLPQPPTGVIIISSPPSTSQDSSISVPEDSSSSFISSESSEASSSKNTSGKDSESPPPSNESSPSRPVKSLPQLSSLDINPADLPEPASDLHLEVTQAIPPPPPRNPLRAAQLSHIHKSLPPLHPRSPRSPQSRCPSIIKNGGPTSTSSRTSSPALPVVSSFCVPRTDSPRFSNDERTGSEGLHRPDPAVQNLQNAMDHELELEHRRALEVQRLKQIQQFTKTVHPAYPARVDPPIVQKPAALTMGGGARRVGEGEDYDFEAIDELAASPSLSMIVAAASAARNVRTGVGADESEDMDVDVEVGQQYEGDDESMDFEDELGSIASIAGSPVEL